MDARRALVTRHSSIESAVESHFLPSIETGAPVESIEMSVALTIAKGKKGKLLNMNVKQY